MPHQAMYLLLAFATAARPAAILELSSFQIDCDARLIKLNPPGRKQNKKRRPTLPICDTLLPYLRNLPPGPVVHYQGRALGSFKKAFDRLTRRAARSIREEGAEICACLPSRKASRGGVGRH
jgi:integrase